MEVVTIGSWWRLKACGGGGDCRQRRKEVCGRPVRCMAKEHRGCLGALWRCLAEVKEMKGVKGVEGILVFCNFKLRA